MLFLNIQPLFPYCTHVRNHKEFPKRPKYIDDSFFPVFVWKLCRVRPSLNADLNYIERLSEENYVSETYGYYLHSNSGPHDCEKTQTNSKYATILNR